MKAFHKKMIGVCLAAFFCFSPVSAFAAETPVSITSGLDLANDTVECTFDENRLIYGEAVPNTKVTLNISTMNGQGEMENVYSDTLCVGSLGLFSTTFPLKMGHNYITVTAKLDGHTETTQNATIKRVPQQVKQQLKRMIALPGLHAKR
ncbi:MAG: hypothetical protein IKI88_05200 [Anaerotignum sp.]|nr:hypothetical protein [Anaerotignum sp.]